MSVFVEGIWNGYQFDKFKTLVKEILIPFMETDIVMSVPHGRTCEQIADGKFYIRIWSGAGERKSGYDAPKKIWGIDVDCRDAGFVPSGQGIPIVDTETGWAVAELVEGSNLYIHHDICHYGDASELRLFRRLLEEVVVVLSATPEERAERQRKLVEVERARAKEAFVLCTMKRFEKTVKGTEKAIANSKEKIEDLQRKLTAEVRRLRGKERKLRQLKASEADVRSIYEKQFEAVLKSPQITKITVNPDNLQQINVFTTELHAHEGEYHKILGRYRLEIYMDGSNGGVKAFNLDRQVDGFWRNCQHPHVNNSGTFCLGEMKEAVPQLIGEDQIAGLAMMMINHLQRGINLDDPAGAYLKDWPDIPGDKKQEEK